MNTRAPKTKNEQKSILIFVFYFYEFLLVKKWAVHLLISIKFNIIRGTKKQFIYKVEVVKQVIKVNVSWNVPR